MKKICVLVSGGRTNLQALIDAEKSGIIKKTDKALNRPLKVRPKHLTIGGLFFYGKIQL